MSSSYHTLPKVKLGLNDEPELEPKHEPEILLKSYHTLPKVKLGLNDEPELEPKHEPEILLNLPFSKFYEDWLKVQDQDLHELMATVKAHAHGTESTQRLSDLVSRVMSHYEDYYREKLESIMENVLLVLNPDWLSKFEDAFLWIGGWRPTMEFHLLFSKAGLQFEAGLSELLSGVSTGDLGDLSASQLVRVDELQRTTIREERKLTERLASHQETVADSSMVELSRDMSESTRERVGSAEYHSARERVNTALAPKEHGLQKIMILADEMRLKTLRNVVEILSPIQALHFLIAVTQHHLRVHEWGLEKDKDEKIMREARGLGGPKSKTSPAHQNSY